MKSQRSSIRVLLALTLALPLLTACESQEDRTLAEAQACINKATDATSADICAAKVSGIYNEDAFLIRCSSHFVAQGFNENRLANAFKDIKSSSTVAGVTPTTVAFSYMVFNELLPNHSVLQSKYDCERANSPSLARVLSLVEVATKFANLAGAANGSFVPGDTAAIEGYIQNFTANGGSETDLGNLAIGIREDFCVNSSPFSGTDICTKMNDAYTFGGGNPQTIGQQIITLLQ